MKVVVRFESCPLRFVKKRSELAHPTYPYGRLFSIECIDRRLALL